MPSDAPPPPRVVVVTGVAGSGKTTLGRALADRLGWAFVEGDALHPDANVAKMTRGEPLDDDDRAPWLAALADRIARHLDGGEPAVVATSALKRRYREALGADDPRLLLVFLDASPALVRERLSARRGHFFGAGLAASQFDALEAPDDALVLPADEPVGALVERVVAAVGPDGHDPAGRGGGGAGTP